MSLIFINLKHMVDTFLQEKLLIKFCSVDFIGLPYSKTHEFCKIWEKCQNLEAITKINMMPLNLILEIEIFDSWRIYFMGLFPPCFGFVYILIAIDYFSKWIEAISYQNNDSKFEIKFLRENFLNRFEVPQTIISDRDKHFCTSHLSV